jgi:hypothetical protein
MMAGFGDSATGTSVSAATDKVVSERWGTATWASHSVLL